MITCFIRYTVNQAKLPEFETYARMWLDLVPKFGGTHLGYFLPSEGESDVALALFSFPSLAAYEDYRTRSATDPECLKAVAYWRETNCFLRYERSFFRPLLPA
ncbi:NIPSNAP family protein [Roseiterribacter gracilis]|uniref:NIPSNAP family containing protein n=1 Tax=Roseiterribacter gracilis TaxID=2812848 RepID=A0A8S8X779_9PROT|nr:NIPSNAP family containing protein [Rhodospirillales bacterium TMPK1]